MVFFLVPSTINILYQSFGGLYASKLLYLCHLPRDMSMIANNQMHAKFNEHNKVFPLHFVSTSILNAMRTTYNKGLSDSTPHVAKKQYPNPN